ncbi:TPA: hypothetical protein EYO12_02295 [Candidatus Saccharibacteria bacterium]|nr:hypothetical protein [Candidatus Saccharibacteria bacterium]HIO87667.1 hypothetical protein [Candidatus Saccharibacteria bacterium]
MNHQESLEESVRKTMPVRLAMIAACFMFFGLTYILALVESTASDPATSTGNDPILLGVIGLLAIAVFSVGMKYVANLRADPNKYASTLPVPMAMFEAITMFAFVAYIISDFSRYYVLGAAVLSALCIYFVVPRKLESIN